MRPRPLRWAVVIAVLTLTTAAGCSGAEVTKAGGGGDVLTLRLGTDDLPGRPAAGQIEAFAREVARMSDGRIRIGARLMPPT